MSLRPGIDYRCLTTGNCVPLNAGTQGVFAGLQAQLNRVRRLVGLLGDVKVDGIIGASTTAKLIKVAQKLGEQVHYLDDALEEFAIEPGPGQPLPTQAQVAMNADDLSSALARNGVDYAHSAPDTQVGSLLDPYMNSTTQQGGGVTMPILHAYATTVVATTSPTTQQTAPGPLILTKPGLSLGAKIGIGVGAAGLLAALGVGAAALARR